MTTTRGLWVAVSIDHGLVAVRETAVDVGREEHRHRERHVRQRVDERHPAFDVVEDGRPALARPCVDDLQAIGPRPEPGGLAAPLDRGLDPAGRGA